MDGRTPITDGTQEDQITRSTHRHHISQMSLLTVWIGPRPVSVRRSVPSSVWRASLP